MPWAGSLFAVFLILSFGLIFNAVQANSIAGAVGAAFGIPKLWIGVTIAILAGVFIFGGIRSMARFAEFVVPFMAGFYVLLALIIMAIHITEVPGVLATIVKSAFGLEEAGGAVLPVQSLRPCSMVSSGVCSPTRPEWGRRLTLRPRLRPHLIIHRCQLQLRGKRALSSGGW